MASQQSEDSAIVREAIAFLAAARTRAAAEVPDEVLANDDHIPDAIFAAIGVARLREQFGSPDAVLRLAGEVALAAQARSGFLTGPDLAQVVDLIALARYWLRSECWRPLLVEIKRPTEVQGRRVTFTRATSRRPSVFSLAFWRGERR